MKKIIIDSRKLIAIDFNMGGLFCPLSFRKIYDDGGYEWILPPRPNDERAWTIKELKMFIKGVMGEYPELREYTEQMLACI